MKQIVGAVIAGAVVVSLGVSVTDEKPPLSTPVLLHVRTQTYFAPVCLDPATIEKSQYRVITLGEAYSSNFKLDYDCRNSGAFSNEGTSAFKFLLIKLGLASYPRRWWDQYRN